METIIPAPPSSNTCPADTEATKKLNVGLGRHKWKFHILSLGKEYHQA